MIYLCLFLLFGDSKVLVEGHEIFGGSISAAVTTQEVFLVQTYNGGTNLELHLHNYETNKTYLIEDGRIPKTLYRIIPSRKGFSIYAFLTGTLFYLDFSGDFVKKTLISAFNGAETGMSIVDVFPYDGKALLTYDSYEDDGLFLAVMDVDANTIETKFRIEKSPDHALWVPGGKDVYFVDIHSSEIKLFEMETMRFSALIHPALELLPNPIAMDGNLPKNHKIHTRLRNKQRLMNPLPTAEGLWLESILKQDERRILKKDTMFISGTEKRRANTFKVSSYGDQMFMFDLADGRLFKTAK